MGDVSLEGHDLKALLDSVRPLQRRGDSGLLTVLCSVRRLVECDGACWRWWALAPTASTYVHVHDPADDDPDRTVLELLRPHLATALRGRRDAPPALTSRQSQVRALVADGLSDRQVARRLGLSESTVGKHLEQVYQRTGARSLVHAVRLCVALELASDDHPRPAAAGLPSGR
jgi:DNA-binding CsgD family transcriptional regulator